MQFLIREVWVHPLNRTRTGKGEFYTLYPDLWHYPKKFFGVFHMDRNQFYSLLCRVAPWLLKQDMNYIYIYIVYLRIHLQVYLIHVNLTTCT